MRPLLWNFFRKIALLLIKKTMLFIFFVNNLKFRFTYIPYIILDKFKRPSKSQQKSILTWNFEPTPTATPFRTRSFKMPKNQNELSSHSTLNLYRREKPHVYNPLPCVIYSRIRGKLLQNNSTLWRVFYRLESKFLRELKSNSVRHLFSTMKRDYTLDEV